MLAAVEEIEDSDFLPHYPIDDTNVFVNHPPGWRISWTVGLFKGSLQRKGNQAFYLLDDPCMVSFYDRLGDLLNIYHKVYHGL